MRLEGRWGKSGAPYFDTVLVHEELNIEEPIKFLVDTGASKTHILNNDAKRLKIDYSRLQKHKKGTTGIGGVVETYIIANAKLFFRTHNRGLHEERLKNIFVLKHHPSLVESGILISLGKSTRKSITPPLSKVFFSSDITI